MKITNFSIVGGVVFASLLNLTVFAQLSSNGAAFYPFTGNAKEIFNGADGVVKGVTLTTDVFGRADNAYQFSSNRHIELPDVDILKKHQQDYVIAAWIYLDSYSSSYHSAILSNRNNDNSGCLFRVSGYLAAEGPGKISYVAGAGNDAVPVSSSFILDLNKWYHVIMSYQYFGNDSNIVCFYVDGQARGKGYIKNTLKPTKTNYIGFEPSEVVPDEYHFNGKIDDLILLAYSLDTESANKTYNECKKTPGEDQSDEDRYGFSDGTATTKNISGTVSGIKINYTDSKLIVATTTVMPIIIQLYDISGRTISSLETTDNVSEISLAVLPVGIYIVNVINQQNGTKKTQKIVKY